MKEYIWGYWRSLYNDIPMYVYVGLFIVLVLSAFFLYVWDKKNYLRKLFGILALEYVFLLFCTTVVFRSTEKERLFNIMPFWSYGAYFRGEDFRLLPENMMNVVVFIPFGVLLGASIRKNSWIRVIIAGCCISVSIEVLQLVSKRGFCEFDDVMHNTLGCLIGYGVYRLIFKLVNSKMKRIYGK